MRPPIKERTRKGVRERKCTVAESPECKGWSPVEEFPTTGDDKPRACCRLCKNARKKRYRDEGRITVNEEAQREAVRRWNANNREKRNRQHREYMERVKADPERHARHLEARRMEDRLRQERRGRSLDEMRNDAPLARTLVPSAPIAAVVRRVIDHRQTIGRLIDDVPSIKEIVRDLGVSDRTYRRWLDGTQPTVRIGAAEKVMLNADVEPWEVYSTDDHPEALALFDVDCEPVDGPR